MSRPEECASVHLHLFMSFQHEEAHVEQGTSQSNKSDELFDVECVASSVPMDKQRSSGTKDDPSYELECERTSHTPRSEPYHPDIAENRSVEVLYFSILKFLYFKCC